MKKNRKNSGFTLVELLITVAVIGVLVTMAIPSLSSFAKNNRIEAQAFDLHAYLLLARSEGIKRAQDITVCASSNGSSCTGSWGQGMISFIDIDADAVVDTADGDEVLSVREGLDGGNSIVAATSIGNNIRFNSRGFLSTGVGGVLSICDDRGSADAKGIRILAGGQVTSASSDIVCS